MIGTIWEVIIKQPIEVALVFLAQFSGNMALAIIVLTIVIQLVMLPLRLPSVRSAQKIKALKPELDRLKEKHQDDKMAMAQAQMNLYKEHNISPLGGILPILLSIPIIIALYQVLLSSLSTIEGVSTTFLWLDVVKPDPFYIIPILVAAAQFISTTQLMQQTAAPVAPKVIGDKKSQSPEDMAMAMQKQMRFIFPLMSAFFTAKLPSGIGLYWLTSVGFAIIQQHLITRKPYGLKNATEPTN